MIDRDDKHIVSNIHPSSSHLLPLPDLCTLKSTFVLSLPRKGVLVSVRNRPSKGNIAELQAAIGRAGWDCAQWREVPEHPQKAQVEWQGSIPVPRAGGVPGTGIPRCVFIFA